MKRPHLGILLFCLAESSRDTLSLPVLHSPYPVDPQVVQIPERVGVVIEDASGQVREPEVMDAVRRLIRLRDAGGALVWRLSNACTLLKTACHPELVEGSPLFSTT